MDTTRLNFCFLSGLPRTGSTVLSAILSQNPLLHAGQASPVCQLMWDAQVSCETTANELLAASRRLDFQQEYISAIPHLFYAGTTATTVVDKHRSWPLPGNMAMIRRYITDTPRVIVMTRPLDEITASFIDIYRNNGRSITEAELLVDHSEPIMRAHDGVEWAKLTNEGEFLFVEYGQFMEYPEDTMDAIYQFCGLEPFNHTFDNIVCLHPETDSSYGLDGLHAVRPQLGYRQPAAVGAARYPGPGI